MGRISDQDLYPNDQSLSGNERLLGSDDDNTTRNFVLSAIAAYVSNALNLDGKLDRGSYSGTAQDLATLINNLTYQPTNSFRVIKATGNSDNSIQPNDHVENKVVQDSDGNTILLVSATYNTGNENAFESYFPNAIYRIIA